MYYFIYHIKTTDSSSPTNFTIVNVLISAVLSGSICPVPVKEVAIFARQPEHNRLACSIACTGSLAVFYISSCERATKVWPMVGPVQLTPPAYSICQQLHIKYTKLWPVRFTMCNHLYLSNLKLNDKICSNVFRNAWVDVNTESHLPHSIIMQRKNKRPLYIIMEFIAGYPVLWSWRVEEEK